jgi:glucosylceramidase
MKIHHVSTTEAKPWTQQQFAVRPLRGESNLATTGETCQRIRGFGGCFNELGEVALRALPATARKKVMQALFGDDGCRFNFCRLPIGASDFALEWYSLNDTDGDYAMKHFSIARDEKYLLPYVKDALRVRKDISFFASPWSPPAWMKTHRTFNHGTLRWEPRVLKAYCLYFQKYVEAYHRRGINVTQIHVQNEPVSDQKFPSCVWTGEELREFIADYIGPWFEKHKLPAEVWLGTMNGPEKDHRWPWTRFDQYANNVLSDPKAARYTKGVAYQWAGKNAVQQTHNAYPHVPLIQSESECGDGKNTWRYAMYVWELMQHYFTNYVDAYIYWNMVLPAGGKSTWGWTQNSMVTVDTERGTADFTHEFYVMKHLAQFVKPGAVRLALQGQWTSNSLCFRNPDGTLVLAINNPFQGRELRATLDGQPLTTLLPPESLNTYVLPARAKGA